MLAVAYQSIYAIDGLAHVGDIENNKISYNLKLIQLGSIQDTVFVQVANLKYSSESGDTFLLQDLFVLLSELNRRSHLWAPT